MFKRLFQVSKPDESAIIERMSLGIFLTGFVGMIMAMIYVIVERGTVGSVIAVLGGGSIFSGLWWLLVDSRITKKCDKLRRALWYCHNIENHDLKNQPSLHTEVLKELGSRIKTLMMNNQDNVDSLCAKIYVKYDVMHMILEGNLTLKYAIEVAHRIASHYNVPLYDGDDALAKDILPLISVRTTE